MDKTVHSRCCKWKTYDDGDGDGMYVPPPRASFRAATVVGQSPSGNAISPISLSTPAGIRAQEEQSWDGAEQQIWQRQQKEEKEVQLDHELHRRKQVVHPQELKRGQEEQEERDVPQIQRVEASLTHMQTTEDLRRSISGTGRLQSVTRLSSGEFHMWRTFLLPTAATALSVPMLIIVGSAPVLCMLLFITCLHNVLIAMFMMHWVCMVAVPLLYVKFVEKSFDYYAHVWRVQSCRFAGQWKRGLLLACVTAILFYVIYGVLRHWGGPWFAAVLNTARVNALVAGLDLPFVSLLGVACYFCLCNPVIEEWFWRVFLYREFGGAVFFITENRMGILVLRETPPFSALWNMVISSQDTTTAGPPSAGGGRDSSCRGADTLLKAVSCESFPATDAYSYQRLSSETEPTTAAEKEKQSLRAGGSPATYVVSSSSRGRGSASASGSSSGEPSSSRTDNMTSRSFSSSGSFAKPVERNAADTLPQDNSPADTYPFVAGQASSESKETPLLPLRPSRSFTIQPTARADALFFEAADGEDKQDDNIHVALYSPVASPLARRGASQALAAAAPDATMVAPGLRDEEVDTSFERRGAASAAARSRTDGDSGSVHRAYVTSPPAPDAPVLTHVGGGLLQVDLRLSLLGQVVLSLFYASYHTVVFGFLTGTVGGCIALPCVAVLGMILTILRNSCIFGLLGGVLVHVGVDLGVVLILGAVLKYY